MHGSKGRGWKRALATARGSEHRRDKRHCLRLVPRQPLTRPATPCFDALRPRRSGKRTSGCASCPVGAMAPRPHKGVRLCRLQVRACVRVDAHHLKERTVLRDAHQPEDSPCREWRFPALPATVGAHGDTEPLRHVQLRETASLPPGAQCPADPLHREGIARAIRPRSVAEISQSAPRPLPCRDRTELALPHDMIDGAACQDAQPDPRAAHRGQGKAVGARRCSTGVA